MLTHRTCSAAQHGGRGDWATSSQGLGGCHNSSTRDETMSHKHQRLGGCHDSSTRDETIINQVKQFCQMVLCCTFPELFVIYIQSSSLGNEKLIQYICFNQSPKEHKTCLSIFVSKDSNKHEYFNTYFPWNGIVVRILVYTKSIKKKPTRLNPEPASL